MTKNDSKDDDLIEHMLNDSQLRQEIVSNSHMWFFYFYFAKYVKSQMAPFHSKWFELTENQNIKNAVIVAFRGSGKTTLFTQSFPIWAILGKLQIKHIMIVSRTEKKAQQGILNIKRELEGNRMLRQDLGPFEEQTSKWSTSALHLTKYNAMITSASIEQSVRGTIFNEHRPQLILVDDMEDLESVRTLESRDKIDDWIMGELIPCGEAGTRIFYVGNLLHNDSVMNRLIGRMSEKRMAGEYSKVPFLDSDGKPTWPGRFPNQASIDAERNKGLSEVAWRREMMLEIIPEEDQIVREEWVHYYDIMPEMASYEDYRFAATGVDLAISEKETADYTAAVSVQIFGHGNERKIYVLPNSLNERLSAPAAVDRVNLISRALGKGVPTNVFVEDVGYQRAFIQYLKEKEIPVDGVQISGHDKHSRLQIAASIIQSGAILFPRHGCENLLKQILGFGVERHDDLVDAFTLIILKLIANDGDGRIVFPKNNIIQPVPKNNDPELEKIDLWLADRELEYKQGTIDHIRWLNFQEDAWRRKNYAIQRFREKCMGAN